MQVKYYDDIIEKTLIGIESEYKYLDKQENSYRLNDKFWEDIGKGSLSTLLNGFNPTS
jgi:hypothetical protein